MATKKGTEKEDRIYEYIKLQTEKNGYPPSVREICIAVGLKSTSSVHKYLVKLEADGKLNRLSNKNRAITVKNEAQYERRPLHDIPVVGKVTAGIPILAQQNIDDYITLTEDMIKDEDSFILTVSGESMINAGILDGDYIIVHRQPNALNGEIVVALIDESATVKRFYKEKNHIRLQPENDFMEPIYVESDTPFEILGKVTGVIRLNIV